MIETIDKKSKFFYTIIYASNSGMERRRLWSDLERQGIITTGNSWIIMGDFNVTLKVAEHSNGRGGISYFTLKKLDRIMVNEEFMDKFQQGHGLFLPYLVFDQPPIIVKIPNGMKKRKSSFRVENLRLQVKECQAEVDKFPHDEKIKEKSWFVLKEYQQATKEEYSLLCQKAKVEWLKDGDKNTAYFHKTIKERMNRGRIMTIRNEEGVRFENKDVATQIVKHFEDF
ncbi:RNA-directed DNA polymerase, eukaryota, reverse transcriptase zinc-binding domain protein [Tanacetum coccineum]